MEQPIWGRAMTAELIYMVMGVVLLGFGLYAVVIRRHMIRKLMAANIFGSGIFVIFVAVAVRTLPNDPVPQAMVLTGIVVAVSATALGLVLVRRMYSHGRRPQLGTLLDLERRGDTEEQ